MAQKTPPKKDSQDPQCGGESSFYSRAVPDFSGGQQSSPNKCKDEHATDKHTGQFLHNQMLSIDAHFLFLNLPGTPNQTCTERLCDSVWCSSAPQWPFL